MPLLRREGRTSRVGYRPAQDAVPGRPRRRDRIHGGIGVDSIHGGFGDDLANGDRGADIVFGDNGADVLWGGKGCDATVDTETVWPDCYANGVFDSSARGTKERMVDYILGAKGAASRRSAAPNTGDLGSDILDWHPRGTYGRWAPAPTTRGRRRSAMATP